MKIALVGVGKIARDQHIPSIAASPDWKLAATCSRQGSVEGIPAYTDLDEMMAAHPDISVISMCMPPVPRFDFARRAIAAGRHVMLEKPPGATLSECHALEDMARKAGVSLFATWHSREANRVAAARDWLADKTITRCHITWREDVRKWHPGQDWVFDPGGMGVFDPGINALSVMTKILPAPVHLLGAELSFPANRQTPIAAQLQFTDNVSADFDWRQEGPQTWDVEVWTEAGKLHLTHGGEHMTIDGVEAGADPVVPGEYPGLYAQMAQLVRAKEIDMDLSPLRHVADALMLGKRIETDAFDW
ncbi:L-arabinose 1-dehydrogenase [Pelagimonas phthalicica]|uniref:L-arabinose 1-dehydrogenase n=1 Tax=Pelagimonas phthalicica TaxID=1037362 RepID=A0A238J9N8_9RHOB|nr:Gfo/Idh/MocA family oxidoreductase [Pelagimonas phthalicica]TDS94096.1 galactose 1-dehydrogenase [Pelagimonas phthalicica]SMX27378.1 L-arabinose 1-dehydrogenase [Pelagimonas phthalicica]